jgi:hypothetical protein
VARGRRGADAAPGHRLLVCARARRRGAPAQLRVRLSPAVRRQARARDGRALPHLLGRALPRVRRGDRRARRRRADARADHRGSRRARPHGRRARGCKGVS